MFSKAGAKYVVDGVQLGIRCDGRDCEAFRFVTVATGFLAQASGSARVVIGATDVVVGVKVEIGSPDVDRPDCGKIFYSVSCSPCASPKYQGRGAEDLEAELTNALERSTDAGPGSRGVGIDLSSLCIAAGKKCWVLYVDGVVVNDDGNLLDALSMAVKAALSDTLIPHVKITAGEEGDQELEFELDDEEAVHLNLDNWPIIISVAKLGRSYAVDLSGQEEGAAEAVLHVAVNAKGNICSTLKRGEFGMDPSTLVLLLEVAQRVGPPLLAALDAHLAAQQQQQQEGDTEEEEDE